MQGIRQAIMAVCDKMLNPQARLKGICGIEKFGKEIIKWGSFDARSESCGQRQ